MLEAYLAFAKGDSGEPAAAIDLRALLEDVRTDVERLGGHVSEVTLEGQATVTVRLLDRDARTVVVDRDGEPARLLAGGDRDRVAVAGGDAFRRCLFNLAANAARYGDTIAITARQEARWLAHVLEERPQVDGRGRLAGIALGEGEVGLQHPAHHRDGPARRLPALPVQPRRQRRPLRRHDRDHRPPGRSTSVRTSSRSARRSMAAAGSPESPLAKAR
jgi:type IV secretory pathway TrbD component